MTRQLTITVDERVYDYLQTKIGPERLGWFIEDLVRPRLIARDELDAGYKAMAAEKEAEAEALEWSEGLVGDVGDEPW